MSESAAVEISDVVVTGGRALAGSGLGVVSSELRMQGVSCVSNGTGERETRDCAVSQRERTKPVTSAASGMA